jgi:hypothetical protein
VYFLWQKIFHYKNLYVILIRCLMYWNMPERKIFYT